MKISPRKGKGWTAPALVNQLRWTMPLAVGRAPGDAGVVAVGGGSAVWVDGSCRGRMQGSMFRGPAHFRRKVGELWGQHERFSRLAKPSCWCFDDTGRLADSFDARGQDLVPCSCHKAAVCKCLHKHRILPLCRSYTCGLRCMSSPSDVVRGLRRHEQISS